MIEYWHFINYCSLSGVIVFLHCSSGLFPACLYWMTVRFLVSWQKDNVSNQREHVVHLLANEQSRLRIPEETEPVSFTCLGGYISFWIEIKFCACKLKLIHKKKMGHFLGDSVLLIVLFFRLIFAVQCFASSQYFTVKILVMFFSKLVLPFFSMSLRIYINQEYIVSV